MFLKRAMRYYRVWIYSCNLALFISTLIFIILLLWIASDYHLSLFPTIRFYQPTFIYAYVALTLQAGILQAIGCVGANRMNEKLLHLYWKILIATLLGDLIVGIVWLFRYIHILKSLKSDLMYRVSNDYGFDPDFQELWDRIQSEHECCGVDAPFDYNLTQWFQREHSAFEGASFVVPQSCCAYAKGSSELASKPSADCLDSYRPDRIYTVGCYGVVLEWIQSSVDTLSVLGFCVITFLKLCFSFILRYEIREMIQKIQIIKGERERSGSTLQNLEAYLPRPSIQNDSCQALLSNQSQNVKHRHRGSSAGREKEVLSNPRTSLHPPNLPRSQVNSSNYTDFSAFLCYCRKQFKKESLTSSVESSVATKGPDPNPSATEAGQRSKNKTTTSAGTNNDNNKQTSTSSGSFKGDSKSSEGKHSMV